MKRFYLFIIGVLWSLIGFGQAECNFGTVHFETHECEGSHFLVDIEFVIENPGSEGFTITANDDTFGPFDYGETYYTFGPLNNEDTLHHGVWITDIELGCVYFFEFENNCGQEEECGFNDFSLEFVDCYGGISTGSYLLNFNEVNVTNEFFDLFIGDEFFGYYSYESLPIELDLPSNANGIVTLTVCDNDNPECCYSPVFETVNCNDENNCLIDIYNYEIDCVSDQFYLTIQYEYIGVGNNEFTLVGNGTNYGTFPYGNGLVTIGPLNVNVDFEYEFVMIDNEINDCSDFIVLDSALDLCGENCNISFDVQGVTDCEDGLFYVYGFAQSGDTNEELFYVLNGDAVYGPFSFFVDGPILIGPFEGNGDYIELIMLVGNDGLCQYNFAIESPFCGIETFCEFDILDYEVFCQDTGYVLVLNYGYFSELGEGIMLVSTNVGEYEVSVENGIGSFELGEFSYNHQLFLQFLDQSGGSCGAELTIGEINENCEETNICLIEVEILEVSDCFDGNVEVAFYAINDGQSIENITLTANSGVITSVEELLGTNHYLVHLSDVTSSFLTLNMTVGDEELSCSEDISLGFINCLSTCHWYNVNYSAECLDNGDVELLFTYDANISNFEEGFSILGNGNNYGSFDYSPDSTVVLTINPEEDLEYEFIFVDNANEDCSLDLGLGEFNFEDCNFEVGECLLDISSYEILECQDGLLFIEVELANPDSNPNDGLFVVYYNNTEYGAYPYGQDSYVFGPFEYLPNQEVNFVLIDELNPECFTTVFLPIFDCNDETDCYISPEYINIVDCENGAYYLTFELDYANEQSDNFLVTQNGIVLATYPYGQVNYVLGPFQANQTNELVFCDAALEGCTDTVVFEPMDCGQEEGDCDGFFSEVFIEISDCYNDGLYDLSFNLALPNLPPNMFLTASVTGLETFEFSLGDLPFTIIGIPLQDSPGLLTICTQTDFECCIKIAYEEPQCEGLIVWPGDTNNDNIADHLDLFNIGSGFGVIGTQRDSEDITWAAHESTQWNASNINGVNYAHSDTNGDGEVNQNDVLAISQNFGNTHGDFVTYQNIDSDENDPSLQFLLNQEETIASEFQLPLNLESENNPMLGLFGLGFTIEFDANFVQINEVIFNQSFFGTESEDMLSFAHIEAGKVHVSIVKTDQNPSSGYGTILYLKGNAQADSQITFEIKEVYAIDMNFERLAIQSSAQTSTVSSLNNHSNAYLTIYPNPANNIINLDFDTQTFKLEDVQIFDLTGRLLLQVSQKSISIQAIPQGVYMLKAQFDDGIKIIKFVKH